MPTERKNKSTSTSPNINDSQNTLNIRQRTFPSTSTSSTYPLGISFLSTSNTLNESEDMAYIEKRTAHNALERQRREGLNSKFQELAHVLPALQQIRRPSKSMIVTKSLEFVSKAEERRNDYEGQLDALRLENAQLLRQAEISTRRIKKHSESDSSTPKKAKKQPPKAIASSSKPMSIIKPRKSASKMKPQLRQPPLSIKNQSSLSVISSPLNSKEEALIPESNTSPVHSNTRIQNKRSREDQDSQETTSINIAENISQPPESTQKRRRRNLTTEINNSSTNNVADYQSLVDQHQQRQVQVNPNRHNRYSSHQPFSTATNLNEIISPGPSRHNSINSNQLTTSYSHDTIDHENDTLVVPSQFDIVATSTSPFGTEHTYYNTYENFEQVVSAIPPLTTPMSGNNNDNTTNVNQQPYDPTLDNIFNSLMQDQNPSNNNTNYYWHP